jgi:diaminopimelate epimerase
MNKKLDINIAVPTIDFYKMQGSGNDFIIMDNRSLKLSPAQMSDWAKQLCRRSFSVGADGIIFLDTADAEFLDPLTSSLKKIAYKWHFYNSDGSRASLCGNGSRCISWLAVYLKIAEPVHCFQTDAGLVEAHVDLSAKRSRVLLPPPKELKLDLKVEINQQPYVLHFVNTGVPHSVIFVEDIKTIPVKEWGRIIRFHSLFGPQGTNVNFVQRSSAQELLIRTYERGVEDETFACGTGCAASAFIAYTLGLTGADVNLITTGQENLRILVEQDKVWLEGPIDLVYYGNLYSF